ncbi:Protein psiA, partial [Durusdinium trenchii]
GTSVYLADQQNVGTGFNASFTFSVSETGPTDGFAIVLHNADQGLDNLPTNAGINMGYAFLRKSVAIVFDLCSDRDTNPGACEEQEVAIRYPEDPNAFNGPFENTKRVYDGVMRSLRYSGESHTVSVEYLETPDWLEVYIDDSLYLRVEGFDLEGLLGGRNAFVGLTSSTQDPSGVAEATIAFTQWKMETVDVDGTKTLLLGADVAEPKEIEASGEDEVGFSVQSRDACLNGLTYGGFRDRVKGVYVEELDPSTGTYFNGSLTPAVVPAVVVDPDDGTYAVNLRTTSQGNFTLHVCFGEGCEVQVALQDSTRRRQLRSLQGTLQEAVVTPVNEDFYASKTGAVFVNPVTDSPTPSPIEFVPAEGDNTAVTYVSAGGGALAAVLLVAGVIMLRKRRQWERDRAFIEDGKLYNMDRDVEYDKNDEFGVIGRMVMNTQAEILRQRAQNVGKGSDAEAVA